MAGTKWRHAPGGSQTFVVLLAGEPEARVEVAQHVLVLARLPDVLHGVGQLPPPYPGQLLLLLRGQRHVGPGSLWIRGGGLWAVEDDTKTSVHSPFITESPKISGNEIRGDGRLKACTHGCKLTC